MMLNDFQLAILIFIVFILYEIIKRLLSPEPFKEKMKYIFPSSDGYLRRKLGRDYQFIIESTPLHPTQSCPEPIKPQFVTSFLGTGPHYLIVFPIGIYSWFKIIHRFGYIKVTYPLDSMTEEILNENHLSVLSMDYFTDSRTYNISKRVWPGTHLRKVYMGKERFYSSHLDNKYIPKNLIISRTSLNYRRCAYYRVEFVLDQKDYNLLYKDKDYRYHYKIIYLTVYYYHFVKDAKDIKKSDQLKGCIYYREKNKL